MLELLSPHQVVTCQRHNMYRCNFLDYERIIARLYSKKNVVNFICLNKEFVIVIVIVIYIYINFLGTWVDCTMSTKGGRLIHELLRTRY